MSMGSSQRMNGAMLDGLSPTVGPETEEDTEEVMSDMGTFLDQSLDGLYEKRGSTRELALKKITYALCRSVEHEFVEENFETILHPCLNSFKRGSPWEVTLASGAIGLMALTIGPGREAQEMLKKSVSPITEALRSRSDSSKLSSLLECLAIITFAGKSEDTEATEKSMQVMWQFINPKSDSTVAAVKPSPPAIIAVLSAWSFLLTTMDTHTFDLKNWHQSISYLLTLLDRAERSVRIAAGEALALIFELGGYEDDDFCDDSSSREQVLKQVKILAAEGGGKGCSKKDLNVQRNKFREIREFLEYGESPQTSIKIGKDSLSTTTWAELIQLNFIKHFIRGGFVKHMQENGFLQVVFGFKPREKPESHEKGHLKPKNRKRCQLLKLLKIEKEWSMGYYIEDEKYDLNH